MNTKIERVLFDYDGTLILHDKENEGKQLCEMLGISCEMHEIFEKRLKKLFGGAYSKTNGRKMNKAVYYHILESTMGPLEEFGITCQMLDEAIREKSKVCSTLADGALKTLEYLKQKNYEICLFTNGFYDAQVASMKWHGIFDYFEKVYAWDDFYPKPDPRAFMRALGNKKAMDTIMIGDDVTTDIIPAMECGMRAIGINLKDVPKELAYVAIRDLTDLRYIL